MELESIDSRNKLNTRLEDTGSIISFLFLYKLCWISAQRYRCRKFRTGCSLEGLEGGSEFVYKMGIEFVAHKMIRRRGCCISFMATWYVFMFTIFSTCRYIPVFFFRFGTSCGQIECSQYTATGRFDGYIGCILKARIWYYSYPDRGVLIYSVAVVKATTKTSSNLGRYLITRKYMIKNS